MNESIDILEHPLLFVPPQRVVPPLAWSGHIPFARLLVELMRPQLIVELGTHSGNSYNAFCEAVEFLGLPTRCYAVDTWEGDPQSGHYGAEIYAELCAYQDSRYKRFSTLLRMRFDEALERFQPGSIDLLHIDGLHTYDAVRHDFDTWRPKLSRRGVVLFHDIAVQRDDFGVWRLWQELKRDHPFLEYPHCNGLGLIAVGTDIPDGLQQLIDFDEPRRQRFAMLLEQLGGYVTHRHEVQVLQEENQLRDATLSKLQEDAANLERELSELQRQRDAVGRDHEELLCRADRFEVRLAARERELAMLTATVDEIRQSNSWKLTAPLRWCGRQYRWLGALWRALRTGSARDGK